jgi:hypothetical protein
MTFLALQWLTFAAFAALGALCVLIMWRYPHARGMAAGWLAVALNTAALYWAAFLIWPDRVGMEATQIWSAAVRLHVALTAGWQLWAWARRRL